MFKIVYIRFCAHSIGPLVSFHVRWRCGVVFICLLEKGVVGVELGYLFLRLDLFRPLVALVAACHRCLLSVYVSDVMSQTTPLVKCIVLIAAAVARQLCETSAPRRSCERSP